MFILQRLETCQYLLSNHLETCQCRRSSSSSMKTCHSIKFSKDDTYQGKRVDYSPLNTSHPRLKKKNDNQWLFRTNHKMKCISNISGAIQQTVLCFIFLFYSFNNFTQNKTLKQVWCKTNYRHFSKCYNNTIMVIYM